jgi:O-succinylbenzoic acid--CoA ligase
VSRLSVLDAAREVPRRLALTDGARHTTFAELAERVRQRMLELAPVAAEPAARERLVAVTTGEGADSVETLLALIELGLTFIPLHQRSTPLEREALIAALPVRWTVESTAGGGVSLSARTPRDSAFAAELLSRAPHLAALATSGSTGAPRVALLSRAAFSAAAAASAERLGWRGDERWLLCLPLAHIGGLSVLTRCLLARQTVALVAPRTAASSSQRLALAIAATTPTLISMVPAQLDGLLELEPRLEMPSSLRAILTGGAAASPALLERCDARGWPVLTSYGLTEACSQVATQAPGTRREPGVGVGVPLPGIGVRIDAGVIEISGPTLASAYLGAGGEAPIAAEGRFRTRDLGRIDSSGQLFVLGRVDDVIISGGENVAPWEIESMLGGCDGVLEVCVFGVPDPRWGEVVVAGLRTRAAAPDALVRAVAGEARQRLASFKRPRYYVCATEFIYGKNGKLDRVATAAELRARLSAAPERYRAPSE